MTNKTSYKPIGTLLKEGRLTVPQYQRRFSWGTKHTKKFLCDLKRVNDDVEVKPREYFFGPMVFEEGEKRIIVDGQQRLATTSIFLVAVIGICKILIKEGQDTNSNDQSEKINKIVLDMKEHLFNYNKNPTLTLGTKDNNALRGLIDDESFNGNESSKVLTSNYKTITKWIEDFIGLKEFRKFTLEKNSEIKELSRKTKSEINTHDIEDQINVIKKAKEIRARKFFKESENTLRRITHTLTECFYILAFFAERRVSNMIFETLNSRGKPLKTQDLLKNYILRKTSDTGLDDAVKSWDVIINTIEEENVDAFLLAYYRAHYGETPLGELFHNYCEKASREDEVKSLLKNLKNSSSHFKKIVHPSMAVHEQDLRAALSSLANLDSTSFHPLLLVLFEKKIRPGKIEGIAHDCLVLLLRHKTVMNKKPEELVKMSISLCGTLQDDNEKSVWGEILRKKFQEIFQKHTAEGFIAELTKKQMLENTTARILITETYKNMKTISNTTFQLEHIIPQSVKKSHSKTEENKEWKKFMEKNELKEVDISRIGNFTLLTSEEQVKAGNKPIDEKIKVFKESPLSETKKIKKSDFTRKGFDKRCKKMAKQTEEALRLKF